MRRTLGHKIIKRKERIETAAIDESNFELHDTTDHR
jgi:hypothetical protein